MGGAVVSTVGWMDGWMFPALCISAYMGYNIKCKHASLVLTYISAQSQFGNWLSTSITEEVISLSLVHHSPKHINFVDWMLVIEINA